jgi:hypothetical protein
MASLDEKRELPRGRMSNRLLSAKFRRFRSLYPPEPSIIDARIQGLLPKFRTDHATLEAKLVAASRAQQSHAPRDARCIR